jgi:rhodanese-related sulfurtransferase
MTEIMDDTDYRLPRRVAISTFSRERHVLHWRMKVGSYTLLLLITLSSWVRGQNLGWAMLNFTIHNKFPDVAQIEPRELESWLRDSHREPPTIIDVRTQAEYDVSHLRGARRVEPGSLPSVLGLSPETPIVVYCSVGYRSSAFGESLKKFGFQNVTDLKGSIFQWANESRPLVQNDRPTNKVHPYNNVWGQLLDKQYRAEVPPVAQ